MQYPPPRAVRPEDWRLRMVCMAAVLAAMALATARGLWVVADGSEPFLNNDEPRHIMTAIFWHDFLRVLPAGDPAGFAAAYYGHFPAISPLHWPPLQHVLTACLFMLTGPSVAAARLLVLAQFVLLLLAVWKLSRDLVGPAPAALATVLLAGSGAVAPFSAVLMLEVPCLMWMAAAALALHRLVRTGRMRWAWLCAAAVLCGALTKQHALTIVPALVVGAALGLSRRQWRSWRLWLPAVLAAAATGGYYAFALLRITSSRADALVSSGGAWEGLTAFAGTLPLLMLVMAAVGALIALRRFRGHWGTWLLVAWVAAVVVFYFGMGQKSWRYLAYLTPPLLVLGAFGADRLSRRLLRPRAAMAAAVVIALAWCTWRLWSPPVGHMEGYADAAGRLAAIAPGEPVVFGGKFDGPFVLYRRLGDAQLATVTFRTGKLLGSGNILPDRDYQAWVHSEDEVRQRLAQTGARYIVLEDEPELATREHRWFWNLVASGEEFELVESTLVIYPGNRAGALRIYKWLQADGRARPSNLRLPMPSLASGSLTVDLDRPLLKWNRRASE
jgi:hypothetical protein